MSAALITLAAQLGAPFVRQILSRHLGPGGGQLAADVLTRIADRAGMPVEALERLDTDAMTGPQSEALVNAIHEVEQMSPELVELYMRGLEGQFALLQSEQTDPAWIRAWRPLGMYFTMFLWLWQVVVLHVANAIWKIALPPADWQALIWWTSLYLSLYMGGHTIKDAMAKWTGKGGAA